MQGCDVDDRFLRVSILQYVREVDQSVSISEGRCMTLSPQGEQCRQLRHTAATILLLKNVNPKIVSELLGHASIAITLDTYSHVLPNMQDSAVAAMEEAFSS
jgi:integrase